MRLRRIAGSEYEIDDRNNGHRHEMAFVKNIEKNGLLHEADLLPDSYGGKFHPRAVPELLSSLPVILKALQRGKVTPKKALLHEHKADEAVKRIFEQIHDKDERYELNLYVVGYEDDIVRGGARAVKVAYWPGCVSRGFTPELHGSMAKVAPLLDIELVELDRACCTGAGVIAEHNQELADTLNARTFALAQQEIANGADLMMNICSTCQGAQSECQERLDANSEYRAHVNETLARRGPDLREGHLQQALPLADGRGDRPRRDQGEGQAAADRPARRPVLRLLHRAPDRPPRDRRGAPARPLPADADRGARRHGRRLRRRLQVLRLPDHHDEQGELAPPGRHAPRRRRRRGRGLPRHAVPAVPPQPGPPAAAGRAGRRPAAEHAGAAPAADGRPRARPGPEGARASTSTSSSPPR